MSVFEGTNPQDLITEDWNIADWNIADWSASNGLLVDHRNHYNIRLGRPVVEDFGLPHDSEILMSHVSDGSSTPEHSEDLQIHGTQCSWH